MKKQKTIDLDKKYVRILEERTDGFIVFEFSIGSPELCAEMVLPKADYQLFCAENHVTELHEAPPENSEGISWTLQDALHRRL